MKILVDEDLPSAIAELLNERGYDADHVRSIGLRGASDLEVFRAAQSRKAVLVTADVGFGDVREFPPGSHCGIILFRFPDHFRRREILSLACAFLDRVTLESIPGTLVVVTPGSYRIRRQAE